MKHWKILVLMGMFLGAVSGVVQANAPANRAPKDPSRFELVKVQVPGAMFAPPAVCRYEYFGNEAPQGMRSIRKVTVEKQGVEITGLSCRLPAECIKLDPRAKVGSDQASLKNYYDAHRAGTLSVKFAPNCTPKTCKRGAPTLISECIQQDWQNQVGPDREPHGRGGNAGAGDSREAK